MDIVAKQDEILKFCKTEFKSPTDIGKAIFGYEYHCASSRTSPKCKKLVAAGLLERNHRGWYKAV